ncbi:XTP/dITP diphosphohydrolase [Actinoalloteichus hoggarensis]|uniref:Nucleoside triphosphate pyrophosphohydrolase n=1 Tax=Actinoalloteichus hoggarensis TaxID=1470176 RepID=A0A221VXU3_9PSEU|nr:MazG family protein [Actinoalloteichus hoggarensis]ASO18362.1 Nucleoside triphosphate pyrophosphohydrolase [Actinoalloteichus hoggarensis]MBB5921725.1 XTP/dITP diphosphohydrolase [Actinoalloteichus hoggarensis]
MTTTSTTAPDVTSSLFAGTTVVLITPRLGAVLPAAALPSLRAAAEVYADPGLPGPTREELAAAASPAIEELTEHARRAAIVLITDDLGSAPARALVDAGAPVVAGVEPPGARLLDAVDVMDRLRSPGGCPWDAEQTHLSLRQYLVEEAYELLEALEDEDRPALREELGDVLLQVLFHARIAAEDPSEPFDVDAVAADLVAKLVGRHPHVFAGTDDEVVDAVTQQGRWEELKQVEKQRTSSIDGVAFGQPAVALAAKLGQRTGRARLPDDLLPSGESVGERLFRAAVLARRERVDPEGAIRSAAREFAARVRAAEDSARAAGLDPAGLTVTDWRRHWPADA